MINLPLSILASFFSMHEAERFYVAIDSEVDVTDWHEHYVKQGNVER